MTNDQLERMIEEHNRQIAEVWTLFHKTDEQMQRTDERMQKTDEQIKKTDEQIKERMQKTDEQMKRTDAKIEKLIDNWGRFVEYFLAPGIPMAFQERGIAIVGTAERQRRRVAGETMEIDIMGVDTNCVVLVEVKTTLRPEYVQAFIDKLPRFKHFFPEYKERIIYGAVAGINVVQAADVFAAKHGLWVIAQRGDTVVIQNDVEFTPKVW